MSRLPTNRRLGASGLSRTGVAVREPVCRPDQRPHGQPHGHPFAHGRTVGQNCTCRGPLNFSLAVATDAEADTLSPAPQKCLSLWGHRVAEAGGSVVVNRLFEPASALSNRLKMMPNTGLLTNHDGTWRGVQPPVLASAVMIAARSIRPGIPGPGIPGGGICGQNISREMPRRTASPIANDIPIGYIPALEIHGQLLANRQSPYRSSRLGTNPYAGRRWNDCPAAPGRVFPYQGQCHQSSRWPDQMKQIRSSRVLTNYPVA